jgi:hypothetical protein
MKLKQLQQVLESEKIKIAYDTVDKRKIVLAVGTKPLWAQVDDINKPSMIEELGMILKEMLARDDIVYFFSVVNVIYGAVKDENINKKAQKFRKLLKSFGTSNLLESFKEALSLLGEAAREIGDKDILSSILLSSADYLKYLKTRAKYLEDIVSDLSKLDEKDSSKLIKVLENKLVPTMKSFEESFELLNDELSFKLFEYISGVSKFIFIIETANTIIAPDTISRDEWGEILKTTGELKKMINEVRNNLKNIKSKYKEEHGVDILDAFALSHPTITKTKRVDWVEAFFDLDNPESSYREFLSYLRDLVTSKALIGEANESNDKIEGPHISAGIEFESALAELFIIIRKAYIEVSKKIENYSNEEKEKIRGNKVYNDFVKRGKNIHLLISSLKNKLYILTKEEEISEVLLVLTEKILELLPKIKMFKDKLMDYMKKLDAYLFTEVFYNLGEPHEALLEFLDDLLHQRKSLYDQSLGIPIIRKLDDAIEIYKRTLRDYALYLVYRELADGNSQSQDIYQRLCVTDIEVLIGTPKTMEENYIKGILDNIHNSKEGCYITLHVFLKQLQNLGKESENKEGAGIGGIVKNLEILDFSKRQVMDAFYQKIKNNLAAIASIVQEVNDLGRERGW